MERYKAVVNHRSLGEATSVVLAELVTHAYETRTPLAVLATRESVELPIELRVEGFSRFRNSTNGQNILEFSGVTVTPVERAFVATGTDSVEKPFELNLDERDVPPIQSANQPTLFNGN